jgi:hypothetical protein
MYDHRLFEEVGIEEMDPSIYGYEPQLEDAVVCAQLHELERIDYESTRKSLKKAA